MASDVRYLSGFGNDFSTEALPGALPHGQNSPQKTPYGLIPEQLSGSAFTEKRRENQRSWLYRIRPSAVQGKFSPMGKGLLRSAPCNEVPSDPNLYRWDPMPEPKKPTDFVEGLVTVCVNGDALSRAGSAVHLYGFNRNMGQRFFYNADGDFLIVPQSGELEIRTEFGVMDVKPTEIAVVQRGIKFQVNGKRSGYSRGYICEIYGAHLELPNLGPIGANGLANPRDFLTPVAAFEEKTGQFELVTKYSGELWSAPLGHSPLDVVAWHGNYAPYKYDLSLFNTINTVSFDHPDPSIFTVLTSPSSIKEGVANVDFVIFPPRWMVGEHTFRPPYYHRNIMSEYMGLIHGVYDAKPAGGFEPGGGSLHNCMSPHGPEAKAYEAGISETLKPMKQENTLAFMFESSLIYQPTRFALETEMLQKDYIDCWTGLRPTFDRSWRPE